MILEIIGIVVTAGIGGLAARIRNSRKRRSERIAELGQDMVEMLSRSGIDARWDPEEPGERRVYVGRIVLFRNLRGHCGRCGTKQVLEMHYVILCANGCGVKRLFVGDCCDACGYFVPEARADGKAELAACGEAWLAHLTDTVHIEDLTDFLMRDRRAGVERLDALEVSLMAQLSDVRYRLLVAREASGKLAGVPFRPQLVEKTGT